MNSLPPGWLCVPLEEVCDILDSRRVPVNATEREQRPGDVPYYGATGQVGWIDQHLFDEELVLLGEDGAPFLEPNRSKAYVVRGKSWVNNHAHVLRARRGMLSMWLMHQLNAMDYRPYVSGTTRLKLPQGTMRRIPVLVPPLPEQRRIVDALEVHLSSLDAAAAGLARALANVARYKQAVIDAATNHDERVPLSTMIREPLRNGRSAPRSLDGRGVRVFSISAVTQGDFSERNTKIAAMDPADVEHLWAQQGDIFIQRSNTPELVGTARMFRGPERFAVFPDLLIRVRTGGNVTPEFVELALRSTRVRNYFRSAAQGIAGSMPKIDQAVVERAEIPHVPLALQRQIVDAVAEKIEVIEHTSKDLEVQIRRALRLRQSILQRAFSGGLVPQNPTEGSAEEPAAAASALAPSAVSPRAPERAITSRRAHG